MHKEDLAARIQSKVSQKVENQGENSIFREPLIGFASVDDPIFQDIKKITHQDHWYPSDMLSGAQTVVAFFLPYTIQLTETNRSDKMASREWAEAYVDANQLISAICSEIEQDLTELNIRAAFEKPTYSFDKEKIVAQWSHRHAAFAAGLGTFGLNNLLITKHGSAGRFGSIIIDAQLPPSSKPTKDCCLYKREKTCGFCVSNCPMGVLTHESYDRFKCYDWLMVHDRYFDDLPLTDVCGKCSLGPCAYQVP